VPAIGEIPAEATDPESEEVWRPRRHQRGERRRDSTNRTRKRPHDKVARRSTDNVAEAAGTNGKNRQKPAGSRDDRREGRRKRAKNRSDRSRDGRYRGPKGAERRSRDERRAPEVISAAPPRKAGTDPDSPFAALVELREALEKRGKESST